MQFTTLVGAALLAAVPIMGQAYGAGDSTSTTTISSTSTTYITVTVQRATSSAVAASSSSSSCTTTTSSVIVPYPTGGSSVANYTSVAAATGSVTYVAPSQPPSQSSSPIATVSPGAGAKVGNSAAFLALAFAGVVGAIAL